jgi:DNA repair protein RadA/Sms
VGIFEMTEHGLTPVPDASALFLADRHPGAVGSVVAATVEGVRPLLVEVQALVAVRDDGGRRVATGVDGNRLSMLLAVLERHAGIDTRRADVYASVAGGVRVGETGIDLAVLAAVAGVVDHRVIDERTMVIGEVGLGGEVRGVSHANVRVAEAARMGFTRVVGPASLARVPGVEVVGVDTVDAALAAAFARSLPVERPLARVR